MSRYSDGKEEGERLSFPFNIPLTNTKKDAPLVCSDRVGRLWLRAFDPIAMRYSNE